MVRSRQLQNFPLLDLNIETIIYVDLVTLSLLKETLLYFAMLG